MIVRVSRVSLSARHVCAFVECHLWKSGLAAGTVSDTRGIQLLSRSFYLRQTIRAGRNAMRRSDAALLQVAPSSEFFEEAAEGFFRCCKAAPGLHDFQKDARAVVGEQAASCPPEQG